MPYHTWLVRFSLGSMFISLLVILVMAATKVSCTVESNCFRPILCRPEKNSKHEYEQSYRCRFCKQIYKCFFMKRCAVCSKLYCNDCINFNGNWIHCTKYCETCKGTSYQHTHFFLCQSECITKWAQ